MPDSLFSLKCNEIGVHNWFKFDDLLRTNVGSMTTTVFAQQ